jgi:hypothetical protein
MTRLAPLQLELRVEPCLHFSAEVDGVDHVLPLTVEQARRLGSTLIALADRIERRDFALRAHTEVIL